MTMANGVIKNLVRQRKKNPANIHAWELPGCIARSLVWYIHAMSTPGRRDMAKHPRKELKEIHKVIHKNCSQSLPNHKKRKSYGRMFKPKNPPHPFPTTFFCQGSISLSWETCKEMVCRECCKTTGNIAIPTHCLQYIQPKLRWRDALSQDINWPHEADLTRLKLNNV